MRKRGASIPTGSFPVNIDGGAPFNRAYRDYSLSVRSFPRAPGPGTPPRPVLVYDTHNGNYNPTNLYGLSEIYLR